MNVDKTGAVPQFRLLKRLHAQRLATTGQNVIARQALVHASLDQLPPPPARTRAAVQS